jgi:hypothetical protein
MSVRWSFEYSPLQQEQHKEERPVLFTVAIRPGAAVEHFRYLPSDLKVRHDSGTVSGPSTAETTTTQPQQQQQPQPSPPPRQQSPPRRQRRTPRVNQQDRRRKLDARFTRPARSQVTYFLNEYRSSILPLCYLCL